MSLKEITRLLIDKIDATRQINYVNVVCHAENRTHLNHLIRLIKHLKMSLLSDSELQSILTIEQRKWDRNINDTFILNNIIKKLKEAGARK